MIGFFAFFAILAIVAALGTVLARDPLHSALSLALTLVAVAGVFVLLDAPFLSAIQIIVYAGAILVFFLFVIMLLNTGKLPPGEARPVQRWVGTYLALVLGALVATGIVLARGATLAAPGTASPESVARIGNTAAVATLLYSDYVFPFEIVSLLLTAAVVGAVVLARRGSGETS